MSEKFMFFENFKETADKLPDDLRLKFYDGLTDYVFKGVEPDDAVICALVNAIKPSLDKVEKRGGNHNPTGQNQYSGGQKEVKVGQSGQSFLETETRNKKQETEVKEKDNIKVIQKEKIKKFTKPTVEEISAYCQERNSPISAEQFFNFYESKGWRIGSSPMKDWRAAVRTWEAKERTINAAKGLVKSNDDFWRQL